MHPQADSPGSFSESPVLRETFIFFFKHAKEYLKYISIFTAVCLIISWIIIGPSFIQVGLKGAVAADYSSISVFWVKFNRLLYILLVNLFLFITVTTATHRLVQREPGSLGWTLRFSLSRLGKGFIISLPVLIPLIILEFANLRTGLLSLVAVISLFCIARFGVAMPIGLVEDLTAIQSLKRTGSLTRGYMGSIVFLYILYGFACCIVYVPLIVIIRKLILGSYVYSSFVLPAALYCIFMLFMICLCTLNYTLNYFIYRTLAALKAGSTGDIKNLPVGLDSSTDQ